jgi:hypothetical protein
MYSPNSILWRERERQGQLSINAAACLTHLVAGGLEFPAAQPEVCISWSPRSVLQLHPTPFSSQSSIELSFRSISTWQSRGFRQSIFIISKHGHLLDKVDQNHHQLSLLSFMPCTWCSSSCLSPSSPLATYGHSYCSSWFYSWMKGRGTMK